MNDDDDNNGGDGSLSLADELELGAGGLELSLATEMAPAAPASLTTASVSDCTDVMTCAAAEAADAAGAGAIPASATGPSWYLEVCPPDNRIAVGDGATDQDEEDEEPPPFFLADGAAPVEAPLSAPAPPSAEPAALIGLSIDLFEPPPAYLSVEPPPAPAPEQIPRSMNGAAVGFNVTVTHEIDVDPLAADERVAMRLMAVFQEEELQRRRMVERDAQLALSMSSAFQRDAEAEQLARRAAADDVARSDAQITAQQHDDAAAAAAAAATALQRAAVQWTADEALIASLAAEAEEVQRVAVQTVEDELLALRLATEVPDEDLSGSARPAPRRVAGRTAVPVPGMWAGTRLAPGCAVTGPPMAVSAPRIPAFFSPAFAAQYPVRCTPVGGTSHLEPPSRASQPAVPAVPLDYPSYPAYPRIAPQGTNSANQVEHDNVVIVHRHPDMAATGYAMAPLSSTVPPSSSGSSEQRHTAAAAGSSRPDEVVRALLGHNRVGRAMASWVC